MSAPHVTGLAALLFSKSLANDLDWSQEQVRGALLKGAEDMGEAGWDRNFGYGRINAKDSLEISNPLEPPLAYIDSPSWFKGFRTNDSPIEIRGTVRPQGGV